MVVVTAFGCVLLGALQERVGVGADRRGPNLSDTDACVFGRRGLCNLFFNNTVGRVERHERSCPARRVEGRVVGVPPLAVGCTDSHRMELGGQSC